jgi:hypothetical protein
MNRALKAVTRNDGAKLVISLPINAMENMPGEMTSRNPARLAKSVST